MIVVRVELWPGGDATRMHQIGQMVIANQSGLVENSKYLVVLDRERLEADVSHRRSDGVWTLIRKAIAKAGQ